MINTPTYVFHLHNTITPTINDNSPTTGTHTQTHPYTGNPFWLISIRSVQKQAPRRKTDWMIKTLPFSREGRSLVHARCLPLQGIVMHHLPRKCVILKHMHDPCSQDSSFCRRFCSYFMFWACDAPCIMIRSVVLCCCFHPRPTTSTKQAILY